MRLIFCYTRLMPDTQKRGRPAKPDNRKLNCSLPSAVHDRITQKAQDLGMTRSAVVALAIQKLK